MRGSRFVLEVPGYLEGTTELSANDSSSPELTGSALNVCASRLKGLHVLLIEDDLEAREAIETQLAEWGVHCSSGVGAEEIGQKMATVSGRTVDRIIADFRLPGVLQGVDVIQEVRRMLGYSPPAILVSAEVDPERFLAMLPPCTVYIQKPFNAKKLMTLLLGEV